MQILGIFKENSTSSYGTHLSFFIIIFFHMHSQDGVLLEGNLCHEPFSAGECDGLVRVQSGFLFFVVVYGNLRQERLTVIRHSFKMYVSFVFASGSSIGFSAKGLVTELWLCPKYHPSALHSCYVRKTQNFYAAK